MKISKIKWVDKTIKIIILWVVLCVFCGCLFCMVSLMANLEANLATEFWAGCKVGCLAVAIIGLVVNAYYILNWLLHE